MMTPSPRSRNSSMMGESPSPSQILFTHEEIVVLKLLFSLFDRGGKVGVVVAVGFLMFVTVQLTLTPFVVTGQLHILCWES